MSNFISDKAAESVEIIEELKGMFAREEAIRQGNRDDATFSIEFSRLLSDKLPVFLWELRDGVSNCCLPFFGNSGLFVNLTRVMELLKPELGQDSTAMRESARRSVLEVFRWMPLSFDPSMSRFHLGLCSVLWDVIECGGEEMSLFGLKVFGDIFKSPHPMLLDADFATRLSKFVVWLRSVYTSRDGSLHVETANCAHLLTQLFPGAGESFLVPLIGDMLASIGSSVGAVKTLTFIAYVSRSSRGEVLRPFDQQIGRACVNLLRVVSDLTLRRELILNIRALFHVPELALVFIQYMDDLFEETVFVGVGKSAQEILRPIVVSALAEFTNSVREKIPAEKLRKVIGYFTCALCDSPIPAQFASARILLSLVDQLFNKSSNRAKKWPPASPGGSPSDGSDILREILRATVEKFSSLMLFIPHVIALIKVELHGETGNLEFDWVLALLIGRPKSCSVPLADLLIEGVREIRSLIRTLLLTSKMVIHCLTHRVSSRMLTKSDVSLIESLFEDALKCAHLFSVAAGLVQSAGFEESPGISSSANGGGRFTTSEQLAVACSVQEERELIDQVGNVLIVMPGISLTDLLAKRIGWLISNISQNAQLMSVVNCLVRNTTGVQSLTEVICGFVAVDSEDLFGPPNSVAYFLGPATVDSSGLITHVMPSLDPSLRSYAGIVGTYGLRTDTTDARDVVISIFKTIARQVQNSVATNGTSPVFLEPIVRPFVVDILLNSIAKDDTQYRLGLLRYVFRLMGSGVKTSSTIRELADLAGDILEYCNSRDNVLWLEIGLTLPVRLKSLIPVFESAMNLMIKLLGDKSGGESVSVGLSVLESWVDGLTPDFLFPLIQGHGSKSLVDVLFGLVEPPKHLPVHSAVSGSHAVRATKILGKLGAKTRFYDKSHNVVGYEKHELFTLEKHELLVALDEQTGIELDVSQAVCVATELLAQHSLDLVSLPVALQEPPTEPTAIPEQALADAFALLVHERAPGVIYAAACRSEIIAERAKNFVRENASFLMHAGVVVLSGDPTCVSRARVVLDLIVPHCEDPDELLGLLTARLLVLDWNVQLGVCLGIKQLLHRIAATTMVLPLMRNLIQVDNIAVAETTEEVFKFVKSCGGKQKGSLKKSPLVKDLLAMIVLELVALPARSLPAIVITQFAQCMEISVSELLAGHVQAISDAITNGTGPVFQLTAFAITHALVENESVISNGLKRALVWAENEDELSLLHGQRKLGPDDPATSVGYLLHRATVRKPFTLGNNTRMLQVLDLFALAVQSDAEVDCPLPSYLPPTQWTLRDRICVFLARCLFSYDYAIVAKAETILNSVKHFMQGPVWFDSLLPLCVEIASRAPIGIPEIQGLGRLVRLCVSFADFSSLVPLLMERLHSYLSALRERTYAPMQAAGPGTSLSWRAGMQSDSIVALATITLGVACVAGGGVEKLLVLASQLEAALPGTCGSGQIASPFLAPLIAGCTNNEAAIADELLTKLELHKVFPLVAELVSTPRCLGLRKALQDKCHASSDSIMMRTAAASLVSVLARFDPSYLWIQYCSSAASLMAVLIRNWEASIQTLSSSSAIAGLKQTNQLVLGPGGIVGPADINGFEGRIVAWTIIQFIRAPFLDVLQTNSAFTEMTAEQSGFRVRILLRLACSLALRASIEMSAIQDWFLREAPRMTTSVEKADLVTKSLELIQDPNISSGVKYALLHYVVIPHGADCVIEGTRICALLTVMDEAVRVELLRLLLLASPPSPNSIQTFLSACVSSVATPAVIQSVQQVLLHTNLVPTNETARALLRSDVPSVCPQALVDAVVATVSLTEDIDDKMWRWIIRSSSTEFRAAALRLVARRATSVETRCLALDVALWLTSTSSKDVLGNFFIKHCIGGPDLSSNSASPVSPTLTADFMAKCLHGLSLCLPFKLDLSGIELSIPRVAQGPEILRHCKQLVAANRILAVYVAASPTDVQLGSLCHLVNTSLVSTDKSVCVSLCGLVENWASARQHDGASPLMQCIVEGISAGLQVAANSPSRIKLHPLNPHSAAWSVTPYMAVSVLVALLRGLSNQPKTLLVWLQYFQPALLKSVTQGTRSLVFSLLPQHIHHYPLGLTKYPAPALEQSQELGGAAYPGSLQGPEFVVPTLLHVLRLTHLAIDCSSSNTVWTNSVMWLIESLGPFVALATNGTQSFGQVLATLNFTVPQPKAGGLASVVPAVHVAALVRHALGIVARWNLGMQYSLSENEENEWLLDDQIVKPLKAGTSRLVLSGSTAMVGREALLAHLDVTPVVRVVLAQFKPLTDSSKQASARQALVHAVCMLDGIGVLTPLCDGSVQKLLGFVPKRTVTCFPGSALGKPESLFVLARQVIEKISSNEDLLPALLVGAMSSHELSARLMALSPREFNSRLEWILTKVPWEVLAGRDLAPLFVRLMLGREADLCVDSSVAVNIGSQLLGNVDEKLMNYFIEFLSRPVLEKQSLFRPSVVTMILTGLFCSVPVPLLVHLANQHGLYFEVLDILSAMPRTVEVEKGIETVLKSIGETDATLGAQLESGKISFETAAFLGQERWESITKCDKAVWIECEKNLCDWASLLSVVPDLHPTLRLETFAKTNDWSQVAETMAQYDWSSVGEAKIYAAYLALSFSDSCHTGADAPMKQRVFLADMEASINRSFHHLVAQWNMLPRKAALDLVLLCQEFVEFNEAAVLVTDIRGAITGLRPAYPNPKQLLNSWRDRLPDKHDSLKNWHELISLRMVIFRHIQAQCAVDVVASSHIAPYLHDYPWSLVKLAEVGLDHDNASVAQSALSRFQSSFSKSTDAFNQEIFDALRQQMRLYRQSGNYTVGLNVLNCCAISNSNSQQAAEIAWMQARFMAKRGEFDQAKSTLELSINAYPMIAGAWVTLGDLLWTSDETDDCLRAYLQAVALSAGKSVRLVSRILFLVRKLKQKNFEFEPNLDPSTWPSSVWLGWVPTLVRCLGDDLLHAAAKALLIKVGTSYPQAVVWQVNEEIVEAIRKVHPIRCSQLTKFADTVSAAFDAPNSEEVIRCLDDLRFKRKSATELKHILDLKSEPTEATLVKMVAEMENSDVAERGIGGRIEDVEIPGNYTRFICVPTGSALESYSTVRAVGWGEETRCEGLPRVSLLGSNGLWYAYTVHSGAPAGAGISEQVMAMTNRFFEKDRQSKRRNLKIECLQSIPLNQNCYLRECVFTATSLHALAGTSVDCEQMSAAEVKRLVNQYGDEFLVNVFALTNSAEEYYFNSKKFATSFATCGIFDYLLGIHATSRSPKDIRFSKINGTVYMVGFDLFELVKASEANIAHSVPFRLTRNIVKFIGERNMLGVVPAAMRAAADAINQKATPFAEYLELLSLQEEQDESYSESFSERIRDLLGDDDDMDTSRNLYTGISELIEESMDISNLTNVQPKHFLPWF